MASSLFPLLFITFLSLQVFCEPPPSAPRDSWPRELWSRMYGVPNSHDQWQGPPPLKALKSQLGYEETFFNSSQVRARHGLFFSELEAFDQRFKNPCFLNKEGHLHCLPYGFIIGFPKCATSDLWERLQLHPEVAPGGKETRFFSPGEFAAVTRDEGWVGNHLHLSSFSNHFNQGASEIVSSGPQGKFLSWDKGVILEGTPLTAWYSTQRPDQGLNKQGYDAPPASFLHTLLPSAKLIAMVSEPALRMYSDYFFLGPGAVISSTQDILETNRSASHFHDSAIHQVDSFTRCLQHHTSEPVETISSAYLFHNPKQHAGLRRAVRICAADRTSFALPGTGRLAVSLYVAHLNNWVGDGPWSRRSLLVLRREDLSQPESRSVALRRTLSHLGLSQPIKGGDDELSEAWERMTKELPPQNVWKRDRQPMMKDTRELLSKFFYPFNQALVSFFTQECYHSNVDNTIECEKENHYASLLAYSDSIKDDGGRTGIARSSVDYDRRIWSAKSPLHNTPPRHGCITGQVVEPLVPNTLEMLAMLINQRMAWHDSLSLRVNMFTVIKETDNHLRFGIAVNSEYASGWHHPFILEAVREVGSGKWQHMSAMLGVSDWCVFISPDVTITQHSSDWIHSLVSNLDRTGKHFHVIGDNLMIALKSSPWTLKLVETMTRSVNSISEQQVLDSYFERTQSSMLSREGSCEESKNCHLSLLSSEESFEVLRGLCTNQDTVSGTKRVNGVEPSLTSEDHVAEGAVWF